MSDLNQQPARVSKVHVDGLNRTKDDVVRKIVSKLFEIKNVEQLLLSLDLPRAQLESLNAFKTVQVEIDTDKDKNAGNHDYIVSFHVRENSRLTGGINTVVGNRNDGSVLLHARTPNLLGRGESAHIEWQYGNKENGGFNLGYSQPLCPWSLTAPKFNIIGYLSRLNLSWSGLNQADRGVMLDLSWRPASILSHNIRLMNVWRQLDAKNPQIPMVVRQHCRHDLKASIQHVITLDSRDNTVLPNRGGLIKLVQEYAGLNGDVRFHKHELELQHNLPLSRRINFQTTFGTGLLVDRQSSDNLTTSKPCSIADKFYLGGPLNVRGFKMFGIGPKKDDFVLGGNVFWTAGAHLYTPLPFDNWLGRFRDSLRAHAFVNAGRLDQNDKQDSNSLMTRTTNLFTNRVRLSTGLGLVLSLGNIARLELNYCVPLTAEAGDQKDVGLQFGIGINYV